jgi:hypothetical protein
MLSASLESEYVMCVSDCAEGKRLLKAATQTNPGSVARDAFLEHVKQCPLCNSSPNDPTEMPSRCEEPFACPIKII